MKNSDYSEKRDQLLKRTHTTVKSEPERMNCLLIMEDIHSDSTPKDMITVEFEANTFMSHFKLNPLNRIYFYENSSKDEFKWDYLSLLIMKQVNVIIFNSNLNPGDLENSRCYEFLYENIFDNILIIIPMRKLIVARKWFFTLSKDIWNYEIDDFNKN